MNSKRAGIGIVLSAHGCGTPSLEISACWIGSEGVDGLGCANSCDWNALWNAWYSGIQEAEPRVLIAVTIETSQKRHADYLSELVMQRPYTLICPSSALSEDILLYAPLGRWQPKEEEE
jgi:hypothetical protein